MVKRAILCATCGLIVALAPMAKAGHGVSYGPHLEVAFDQALARLSVDGSLELLRMVMKPVYETKTEEYTVTVKVQIEKEDPVSGQKKTATVEQPETRSRQISVMKLVAVPQTHRISPVQVPLFEIDGTAVPPDSLGERLKKPTLVVITYDSNPLPGYYAFLFKPGTLVVGAAPSGAPPTSPSMRGEAMQDDFTLPAGMPPTFRLAEVDEEDRFSLRMLRTTDEAVTGMRTVMETHKTEEGERQVSKLIRVGMTQQLQASLTTVVPRQHVIAATAEGEPMQEAHFTALRQREYAVVVSRDGKAVDPFWLQNVKPRMLVLVPPVANLTTTAPASYAQGQVMTDQLPVPSPTPHIPEPRGQAALPAGAAPENDDEPAAGQTSGPIFAPAVQ